MRIRSKSKLNDPLVAKVVILQPKTQHAKNRVREYGYVFKVTKVINGHNYRYQVTCIDKNYQRWISRYNDKHFEITKHPYID